MKQPKKLFYIPNVWFYYGTYSKRFLFYSLTASWFLSSNTGTPFWELYTAATEEDKCQVSDCKMES